MEKPRSWTKKKEKGTRDEQRCKLNSVETECLISHYRSIGSVIENTEARLRCQYRSTNIFILHTFTLFCERERETSYFLFYERVVSRVSFVEREVGGEN